MEHEERIALYLDYENLALGARDHLGAREFQFGPIARAMADRGRVIVRRAYADWSYFDKGRRDLTRHHVELIEIPQKMGTSRKNAADIKLAVDAIELAFERPYITTYVVGTGDSDFTPLVHKLRELDKRVIGVGIRNSTSKLLPPACDEFLFYDRLDGVADARPAADETPGESDSRDNLEPNVAAEELVVATLVGMRTAGDAVRGSTLKRAILRKEPTFSETDLGYRNFTEMLRQLAERDLVELSGPKRDPDVDLGGSDDGAQAAFTLLRDVVRSAKKGDAAMAGLKTEMRSRDSSFSERRLGYGSFLQFCRAAAAKGVIKLDWDDDRRDYVLSAPR